MTTAASTHALAPGSKVRDYTIDSVIGMGGFAIVYRAIDNVLQREVAVKEYFPTTFSQRCNDLSILPFSNSAATFRKGIESFLNEAKLLAQFDHPALVKVYRYWEENSTAYIAMQLYVGETLREVIKQRRFEVTEANMRGLFEPLFETLAMLHKAKCYHRDVAPDNILLSENHVPVLLDFGAARKTIEETQVFTAILKPGYAPIEQYGDSDMKQGPWTDIYALAGVMYYVLSGGAPPTSISRVIRDNMPRPRDTFAGRLPARWLDAIQTALAVLPEKRPQNMAEFRLLLGWDEADAPPATLVLSPATEAALSANDSLTVDIQSDALFTEVATLGTSKSYEVTKITIGAEPFSQAESPKEISMFAPTELAPNSERATTPRHLTSTKNELSTVSNSSLGTSSTKTSPIERSASVPITPGLSRLGDVAHRLKSDPKTAVAPKSAKVDHVSEEYAKRLQPYHAPRSTWLIPVAIGFATALATWFVLFRGDGGAALSGSTPAATTPSTAATPAAPALGATSTAPSPVKQVPSPTSGSLPSTSVASPQTPTTAPSPVSKRAENPSLSAGAKPPATNAASSSNPLTTPSAEKKARRAQGDDSDQVGGDGEAATKQRGSGRSARCATLIESFQLGNSLSPTDQRFFQENCR